MCNVCIPMLNESLPVEDFADQLLDMLNQGALSLMVSIGHRTGLYDLMDELDWATSAQIASHGALEERYVREWLASMVSAGIVQYQPASQTYLLPQNHAALLCRRSAPDNIAVFAQYVGMLGKVEDKIVDCFRHGGGVGYEHYPNFHGIMAEDSGQTVLAALDDHILPLVDDIERKLEQGIKVLDIGCGKALALLHLAERFPQSEFYGYDLSQEALDDARETARHKGLENIHFDQRNLTHFNCETETGQFDFITAFDAIHDQAAPQNVLDGIYKSLKPGGQFLMQDIRASSHLEKNRDHPIAPLMYTLSTMHCMTVSLAQGGAGLGTMWGEEMATKMLNQAGFDHISVNQLDHDFQNNFYVMQK